ncbi:MAG: hypothetical protein ACLQBK_08040 [Candidatus Sulfotelmatobacter sp.]
MLITAGVWKRTADKQPDESLVPADILKNTPPMFLIPRLKYAKKLDTRLTQSDFHVFDNGMEQRINYFKKTIFPLKDITREYETSWRFYPKIRGTWGYPPGYFHPYTVTMIGAPPGVTPEQVGVPSKRSVLGGPRITYVIGFVPPTLEAGKCHDVRVEVENHDVGLDRNQYCAAASSHDIDEATREGTDVGKKCGPSQTPRRADQSDYQHELLRSGPPKFYRSSLRISQREVPFRLPPTWST